MRKITREKWELSRDARCVLESCGIAVGADFHTLDSAQVDALLACADKLHYRKPKNANGSRARYFHAFMQRRAEMPTTRTAALLAAIADAEERLQSYADRLRETADQVQRGEINYAHGWNRVRKIANEIASAK